MNEVANALTCEVVPPCPSRLPALHEGAEIPIKLGEVPRGDVRMEQPHAEDLKDMKVVEFD